MTLTHSQGTAVVWRRTWRCRLAGGRVPAWSRCCPSTSGHRSTGAPVGRAQPVRWPEWSPAVAKQKHHRPKV